MTAFQAQIAKDAGKGSKGGRETFFSVSSPLSEESTDPLKELSHTGTVFGLREQ